MPTKEFLPVEGVLQGPPVWPLLATAVAVGAATVGAVRLRVSLLFIVMSIHGDPCLLQSSQMWLVFQEGHYVQDGADCHHLVIFQLQRVLHTAVYNVNFDPYPLMFTVCIQPQNVTCHCRLILRTLFTNVAPQSRKSAHYQSKCAAFTRIKWVLLCQPQPDAPEESFSSS